MLTVTLGKTGLVVNKLGFGALPIQRVDFAASSRILNRALDAGVNFIDTARAYSDSEEKIGKAIASRRSEFTLATKFRPGDEVAASINTSLTQLKTDYVDILQVHNPKVMPAPGDGSGSYEGLLAAKKAGKIRFIGLTAHLASVAIDAARSGLYDTVQFPFSILATDKDLEVVSACKECNVGFIAMKAVSGGLIRNIPAAFAFQNRFDNVVPIWGIQKMEELEQFISLSATPPVWDAAMEKAAALERADLSGSFCRACGYCLPCPAEIEIPTLARLMLLMGRSPVAKLVTDEGKAKVRKAYDCIACGACSPRCPYGLNPQALVKENADRFFAYVKEHSL